MAETFGNTAKNGSQMQTLAANYVYFCRYESGSAGSLASISSYIMQVAELTPHVKCAIYDASCNLLANGTTEEKQVGAGQDGWMIFNFGATKPSVAASTTYCLAIWADANLWGYWVAGSSNQAGYDAQTYGSWPELLTPDTYHDRSYSRYATYEEAPPAAKTLVQAALISIPSLIVLPTLSQIIKVTGGC